MRAQNSCFEGNGDFARSRDKVERSVSSVCLELFNYKRVLEFELMSGSD